MFASDTLWIGALWVLYRSDLPFYIQCSPVNFVYKHHRDREYLITQHLKVVTQHSELHDGGFGH